MLEALVGSIIDIAVEAGDRILDIYEDESTLDVAFKADNSPLTRADQAANKIIVERLSQLETVYPIISEEEKEVDYSLRRDYDRCWLVDPLDGTKEFIKRNGEFTVNIALIEDGAPIMGVVVVPVSGDIYWAIRGGGAYHKSDQETTRLEVPTFTMKDQGVRIVCSRSHLNDVTKAYILQFDQPQTVSKGSSLKFLLMASNDAEIYPRMGPTMEWDTGAAQIILEEAGGVVLDVETGRPLTYNKENLLNPHFIAMARLIDA